jgi:hypothetical protein
MANRFIFYDAFRTVKLETGLRWSKAFQARKPARDRKLVFLLVIGIAMLALPQPVRAGGPRTIAGTSYFDPAVKGNPLTWNHGVVTYYTDQGNLSPLLPGASADAFVADAFSRWTGISTAAVSAVRGGQLAEDVSGSNVSPAGGTIILPTDIRPAATNLPVAIVYDADGAVTNALLGQGRAARVPASATQPTAEWTISVPTLTCCTRW